MEQFREIIEPMAREMGVSAVAVEKWRERGVPHKWRLPLLDEAEKRGIDIDRAWFEPQKADAA
ncbi:MAG: hypothetical protein ACPGSI_16430 [Pikeienuella sp.]